MGILAIRGLQANDTYRYMIGDNYQVSDTIRVNNSDDIVINIPNIDETVRVLASRLGHYTDAIVLPTDQGGIYNPVFLAIPGIVNVAASGMDAADYIGYDDATLTVNILQQMYDKVRSDESNQALNISLWCEYMHTIPLFLLLNDARLLDSVQNSILNVNYPTDVISYNRAVNGTVNALRPVRYDSDITITYRNIPIKRIDARTVQYRIKEGDLKLFPQDLHHYVSLLRSGGSQGNALPERITVLERVAGQNADYYRSIADLIPLGLSVVSEDGDAVVNATVQAVPPAMQAGVDYHIGISNPNAQYLAGPISYENSRSSISGMVHVHAEVRPIDSSYITFKLRRNHRHVVSGSPADAIIARIIARNGTLESDIILLNADLSHFHTYSLTPNFYEFRDGGSSDSEYVADVEVQTTDQIVFADKILAFRVPVNYEAHYTERVPIHVFTPVYHDGARASDYLIFRMWKEEAPPDNTLLEEIKAAVQAVKDDIDDVRYKDAYTVIDSLTKSNDTAYNPIHDHYAGDRITMVTKSILYSIRAKFGAPSNTTVKLVLRKLDGNNFVGDILHEQQFQIDGNNINGKDYTVILNKPVMLEAGVYVIGFVADDIAGNFATSINNDPDGVPKLRWYEGANQVIVDVTHVSAIKLEFNEYLKLDGIKSAVVDDDGNTAIAGINVIKPDIISIDSIVRAIKSITDKININNNGDVLAAISQAARADIANDVWSTSLSETDLFNADSIIRAIRTMYGVSAGAVEQDVINSTIKYFDVFNPAAVALSFALYDSNNDPAKLKPVFRRGNSND